jgi:MFS family permease
VSESSALPAWDKTGQSVSDPASLDRFVAAHLRRNFTALGADYGIFMLGMAFASTTTIVPAFAERLGASNLLIGAIPSVMTLGYSLPPLFFSNYTERLERKLPTLLAGTILERLPLLALALTAAFVAVWSPALALGLFYLSLLVHTGFGGILMPAWMDIIGKVIPTNLRGRLFALGNVIGSGLGLGGAAISGWFLVTYPYPTNYALCFGAGFLCLIVSYFFLAATKEPAIKSLKAPVGTLDYLRTLPDILRRDRDFTWFLLARTLSPFGAMSTGFFTVFALRTLGAPEYKIAEFTLVLLAAQTVANFAFGYLADHRGHKLVLIAGAVALIVGNVLALGCTSVEEVNLLFVCSAIATAAGSVSINNIALEFAPLADRPTYIGLSSTLFAPFSVVAPLIAGLLADSQGYYPVFAMGAAFSVLYALALALRVRDPRHAKVVNAPA